MLHDITHVQQIGDYRLRLTFEDGECRDIDILKSFSLRGVLEPLRDPAYFRQVCVNSDVGTIVWPNGADFCPDVLHEKSTPAGTLSAAG